MPYFKITHEQQLDWDDNDELSTFIMVAAEHCMTFGHVTYAHSNRKTQSAIKSKFNAVGHHTVRCISQFEMKVESGIKHLKEGMRIVGLKALITFLDANSHRPLT